MARNTEKLLGRIIGERYQLEKPLAKGGMGSILSGTQLNLNRPVAIKVVHQAIRDETLLERFRREAEALAAVPHPSIVQIYDFVEEDDTQFLIMEYVSGQNLKDYLTEEAKETGLPPEEAVALLTPICSALVEIHAAGLLHRDIKPANVIRYTRADKRVGVKLVDFGIAKRTDDLGLTSDGFVVGTPQYLSPEVLQGKKHSQASDVYALGIALCELATGARPFDSDELHEIIKQRTEDDLVLPEKLRSSPVGTLITHMLERDETRRPNAAQVLSGLEAIQHDFMTAQQSPSETATADLGRKPLETAATPLSSLLSPTLAQTPASRATQPASRTVGSGSAGSADRCPAGGGKGGGLAERKAPGNGKGGGFFKLGLTGATAGAVGVAITLLAVQPWKGAPEAEKKKQEPSVADARGRQEEGEQARNEHSREGARRPRVRGAGTHKGGETNSGARSGEGGRSRPAEARGVKENAAREGSTGARPGEEGQGMPTVAELVERCRTVGDAAKLYKKADKAKKAGKTEYARRAYHAILRSKGAEKTQRRWAAYKLARIYIRQKQCAGAETVWRTYDRLSPGRKRFPGCP